MTKFSIIPTEIHASLYTYLPFRDCTTLMRLNHFFSAQGNQEKTLKKLIRRDVTDYPIRANQSFKLIYREAFLLQEEIKKALKIHENAAKLAQLRPLLEQTVLLGYEKLLAYFPIEALIKTPFHPNAHNNSYLHLAALQGHTHLVKFLIDQKADVDAIDSGLVASTTAGRSLKRPPPKLIPNFGTTALARAAGRGHADCVKLLLQHSRAINYQSKDDGKSPLHWAALSNNLDCIQLLLKAGALHLQDVLEQFPIDYASEKEAKEMLKQDMEINVPMPSNFCVLL